MSKELKAEVIQAVSQLAKFEPKLAPIIDKLQDYDIDDPIKVTLFFALILMKYPNLQVNAQVITILDSLSTNTRLQRPSFPSRT